MFVKIIFVHAAALAAVATAEDTPARFLATEEEKLFKEFEVLKHFDTDGSRDISKGEFYGARNKASENRKDQAVQKAWEVLSNSKRENRERENREREEQRWIHAAALAAVATPGVALPQNNHLDQTKVVVADSDGGQRFPLTAERGSSRQLARAPVLRTPYDKKFEPTKNGRKRIFRKIAEVESWLTWQAKRETPSDREGLDYRCGWVPFPPAAAKKPAAKKTRRQTPRQKIRRTQKRCEGMNLAAYLQCNRKQEKWCTWRSIFQPEITTHQESRMALEIWRS